MEHPVKKSKMADTQNGVPLQDGRHSKWRPLSRWPPILKTRVRQPQPAKTLPQNSTVPHRVEVASCARLASGGAPSLLARGRWARAGRAACRRRRAPAARGRTSARAGCRRRPARQTCLGERYIDTSWGCYST